MLCEEMLGWFLVLIPRGVLMEGDTCLDPGVVQKLTTTDAPSASSFSRLQGKNGAD